MPPSFLKVPLSIPSLYPSLYPPLYPSLYPSLYPPLYPSLYLPLYSSLYLSLYPPPYFVPVSIPLPVPVSFPLPVSVSIPFTCLFICPSLLRVPLSVPPIYVSQSVPYHPFIYLSVRPFVTPSVSLVLSPSIFPNICVHAFFFPFFCPKVLYYRGASLYLTEHLSFHLFWSVCSMFRYIWFEWVKQGLFSMQLGTMFSLKNFKPGLS